MKKNFIKFLGTAGARFVVMRQLRRSGGIWINLDDTNILLDPGPGSLIRCLASRPPLNPRDLDGVILTHRHLDHSNDVNIIIESMTNGGFDPKGILLAPNDALTQDPVVLQYVRQYVSQIQVLELMKIFQIKTLTISAAAAHHHGVETYGLNIEGKQHSLSYISDTAYFPGLEEKYTGDVLIINVVLLKESSKIQHLSISDVEKIIKNKKPKLAILTHFGMTLLRAKPWVIAEKLSNEWNIKVIAASDGLMIDLD